MVSPLRSKPRGTGKESPLFTLVRRGNSFFGCPETPHLAEMKALTHVSDGSGTRDSGCAEVQVFNTMDGMFLVPYQAVVRRSQWEAVSESFETAWKLHKAGGCQEASNM